MEQFSTNDVLVVLTTWPDVEKARAAGHTLVEEKLVACANIVPVIESIYRWQGRIETSAEALMILKTPASHYRDLETRIRELHTYEVPEIIAFPVAHGLPPYLQWVEDSCH
jgi:periplasmic divalent cation tolerance protein